MGIWWDRARQQLDWKKYVETISHSEFGILKKTGKNGCSPTWFQKSPRKSAQVVSLKHLLYSFFLGSMICRKQRWKQLNWSCPFQPWNKNSHHRSWKNIRSSMTIIRNEILRFVIILGSVYWKMKLYHLMTAHFNGSWNNTESIN